MYCQNCKTDRTSRHDASCHSYCGGNCKITCSYCYQETLIEMAVVRVANQLNISKNSDFLKDLQIQKKLVDDGTAKELTYTIDAYSTRGQYSGPKRYLIYRKYAGEFDVL